MADETGETGSLRFSAWSGRVRPGLVAAAGGAALLGAVLREAAIAVFGERSYARASSPGEFLLVTGTAALIFVALAMAAGFRRLRVFDRAIVVGRLRRPQLAVPLADVDASSIRAVVAGKGDDLSALLHGPGLQASGSGRRGVVLHSSGSRASWLLITRQEPAALVRAVQEVLQDLGTPGAESVAARALPPTVVSARTSVP